MRIPRRAVRSHGWPCHLREQKSAFDLARRVRSRMRTACVQPPVPQREYQNICEPQSRRGTQQRSRRLAVRRQSLNQKRQRSGQEYRQYAIGKECHEVIEPVTPAPMRDRQRREQHQNDSEQQPSRTNGKVLWQPQVHETGGDQCHRRGPSRLLLRLQAHRSIGIHCAPNAPTSRTGRPLVGQLRRVISRPLNASGTLTLSILSFQSAGAAPLRFVVSGKLAPESFRTAWPSIFRAPDKNEPGWRGLHRPVKF